MSTVDATEPPTAPVPFRSSLAPASLNAWRSCSACPGNTSGRALHPAGSRPFGRPNRLAVALTGLALLVSAVAPSAVIGRDLRSSHRPLLHVQHDQLDWRRSLVAGRVHRRRGGRCGHRHGGQPGRGTGYPRQDRLRPRPVPRVAGRRLPECGHQRTRDVHGGPDRRPGFRPPAAVRRRSAVGVSGHGARCPHRQHQGRRRGRRRRCLAGDRGHRLGRPEPLRPTG